MEILFAMATTLAAIIASIAGIGSLMLALTRRVRLRHRESQWRQLLESTSAALRDDQVRQIRALHRRTVAELISLEVAPLTSRVFALGVLMFCVSAAVATLGWHSGDWILESHRTGLWENVRSIDESGLVITTAITLLLSIYPTGMLLVWLWNTFAIRRRAARQAYEDGSVDFELGPSDDFTNVVTSLYSGVLLTGVLFNAGAAVRTNAIVVSEIMEHSSLGMPEWIPGWVGGPTNAYLDNLIITLSLVFLQVWVIWVFLRLLRGWAARAGHSHAPTLGLRMAKRYRVLVSALQWPRKRNNYAHLRNIATKLRGFRSRRRKPGGRSK